MIYLFCIVINMSADDLTTQWASEAAATSLELAGLTQWSEGIVFVIKSKASVQETINQQWESWQYLSIATTARRQEKVCWL